MVDLTAIPMSGTGAKVPVGALRTKLGRLEGDGLGGVGLKVLRNEMGQKEKNGTYTLAVWTVWTVLHVEVRVHAVLCPAVFAGDLAGDDVVAAAMMGALTVGQ